MVWCTTHCTCVSRMSCKGDRCAKCKKILTPHSKAWETVCGFILKKPFCTSCHHKSDDCCRGEHKGVIERTIYHPDGRIEVKTTRK